MDYIVISGIPQYDGRYELDLAGEYKNREYAWIKHHSGYLPTTMHEGLQAGDAELWCILAVIALSRAGKVDARQAPIVFEMLMDAPYNSTVEPEITDAAVEGDAGPPSPSSSVNGATSGLASETSSENQENHPSPTGTPDSATSQSAPQTSAR